MSKRLLVLFLCLFLTAPILSADELKTRTGVGVNDLLDQVDEALVLDFVSDLVAFGPRVTNSPAVAQAGAYILNEFQNMGLTAQYHPWSYSGYSGNNVVATIPDSSGANDEIYIVCAHYDSVPGSPGADDNGSGTAAVLAMAEVFSQYAFDCEIRFVAFDGEEQGLLGSHEYAKSASLNGDSIVAVLNADMIGYAITAEHRSKIKIYYDTASEWIVEMTDLASRRYSDSIGLEVIPSGYTYGSDHYSFWSYGYHAVFYHEYKFNDYYHSSQDIIAHMDTDYMTRAVRLMTATLAEMSDGFDPLPLEADDYSLSYRFGGQVNFSLDAGPANAFRNYLVLGGRSGTSPGTPLPGGLTTLPVNWDGFTDFVLARLNSGVFANFLGALDSNGQATAQLSTGPLPPVWLGRVMHYAYCLEGTPDWDFASNAARIEVVVE